jgi:putative peptidoglycan lipid II flippase
MALEMFAYGLPAFVLLKVLTPAFFARENTKTPMIFAAISAVVNITLGLYLFINIGFQGLALATFGSGLGECYSIDISSQKKWVLHP